MKHIQSRDNPLFKSLKRLAESGRERRKTGQTLLDGVHLVEAYELACGPVATLVVAESKVAEGEIASYVAGRESVVLADSLMRDLGLVDTPSGLLAVVDMPPRVAALDHRQDAVLLDGIQDPGNVGTLLRTAAAAGVKQVLLAPGCAAVWSPKVLRAGQGAHFVLALHEEADLGAFLADYQGTTAVTCLDGATSLYEATWTTPLAWVFGAEGLGVRPELIAAARLKIRIPMPGNVESLNVGAAAAICLFEALRRKLAQL
ncbi:TrmH family RNA methyltransferase [Dechloromonas denitrificans]|uniref:TrmH family RNA methyltransferase n=1 Tax=Dechloromonas denitrificans TaxID=281362 RepID=UPI001CF7F55C|nr:RNA methyltransferase [Dechloromonas denitrificans]UCV02249.1 RNA methyltransferase [Dechloromonas denitrificans]